MAETRRRALSTGRWGGREKILTIGEERRKFPSSLFESLSIRVEPFLPGSYSPEHFRGSARPTSIWRVTICNSCKARSTCSCEDGVSGSVPRLRDRALDPGDDRRRAPGRGPRALCGLASYGRAAVARGRMGPDREQPQREVPTSSRAKAGSSLPRRRRRGRATPPPSPRSCRPPDAVEASHAAHSRNPPPVPLLIGPRRASRRDVDEEITLHLEERTQKLIAQGQDPAAARAAALREFGDIREARAELEEIGRRRVRHLRRANWWSDLRQDLNVRRPLAAACPALHPPRHRHARARHRRERRGLRRAEIGAARRAALRRRRSSCARVRAAGSTARWCADR